MTQWPLISRDLQDLLPTPFCSILASKVHLAIGSMKSIKLKQYEKDRIRKLLFPIDEVLKMPGQVLGCHTKFLLFSLQSLLQPHLSVTFFLVPADMYSDQLYARQQKYLHSELNGRGGGRSERIIRYSNIIRILDAKYKYSFSYSGGFLKPNIIRIQVVFETKYYSYSGDYLNPNIIRIQVIFLSSFLSTFLSTFGSRGERIIRYSNIIRIVEAEY